MTGKQSSFRLVTPALTVLLLLLVLLSGCGRPTDTSGLSGRWMLDSVQSGTVSVPECTVAEERLFLRLDPDGNGVLSGSGSEGRIRWHYEDGTFSLQAGSSSLKGIVSDHTILLSSGDSETQLRFVPWDGNEPSASPDIYSSDAFLGNWYGWWKIEDSSGTMPVSWYDCCASFAEQEDGVVLMTLWDEDGSRSEPLSEVSFTVRDDLALVSLNGYFAFCEISEGDWTLPLPDPAVFLQGFRHESEGESFLVTLYLRPWGQSWADAEEEQRPFYYEDWYLPLMKQNAKMPDEIPWRRLEEKRGEPADAGDANSDRR